MSLVDNYGWSSSDAEHSHKYLLPVVLKQLNKYAVEELLDIGTGNGATIPFWQKNGFKVSAMEPDKIGFEFANKHSGADVRLLGCGDPIPSAWQSKFSCIISLEVIEHMFDPKQLADTSREVLGVGGIAIITTPYHGYIKNLLLAILDKWDFHHHPNRCGGHIKFWSKKTISKLFVDNGFEILEFNGAGRIPYLWKSMVLSFRKI